MKPRNVLVLCAHWERSSLGLSDRRRRVAVELPEFAIRAIQCRVEEANAEDDDQEQVTFNDVIEWLIVTEVAFNKMPLFESNIPGFTAAMFVWLIDATYQPEDD